MPFQFVMGMICGTNTVLLKMNRDISGWFLKFWFLYTGFYCVGLYASDWVHGVLNGIELEFVQNFFISCSSSEISWAKVQYADVGLQPEMSQEWIKT